MSLLQNPDISEYMEQTNLTIVIYFIVKGISDVPQLQVPIFILVLLIYLFALGGNMTILLLVYQDIHLHTPMYFLLGNLSVLDMSTTTVALHKVLTSFIFRDKRVSYINCIAQLYVFSSLTSDGLLILTAMSYDRYVAICNPLHYPMIMNRRLCNIFAIVCWVLGFVEFVPYVIILKGISCYRTNVINHFFCDYVPFLKLSCSDILSLEILKYTVGMFIIGLTPFLLKFISYVFIIVTILRIKSSTGRRKTFYTCSSHLTVVILLYVTLFCQYLRPNSLDTVDSNKFYSLFNTATAPVLNPLIYSLRNKDVKSALRRRIR
ncbi:olfactory receptor 6C1-like [Discoglossus pictus]